MKGIIFCLIVLCILSGCFMAQDDYVSVNHSASDCGGFDMSGKSRDVEYDPEDYCTAEKLRWEYNPSGKRLDLLITRKLLNCGAEPEMKVKLDGGDYVIEIEENVIQPMDCLCYFDLYCEVPDMEEETITVIIEDKIFYLDLAAGSGEEILDEDTSWPCP